MSTRFRFLYILLGTIGLVLLAYEIIANLPEFNPERVLLIALPDMLLFFLAYKTYPEESKA
ncbi:hypothetical protein JN11_01189 [Mucilaginibacter frigoritolerans]|uniref:Uncharacterized protein n=1 Tax=Mucilaginibacter frigoritolerans TaxID=652788 RepID=A0A562UA63_9SPHI|nr:hypothetical protein [Mucilaginibacter frigoritolerans]TWJ02217.1 hypothetical protein JN11_01189 [Mucilaginibacter frigoritolerans]